MSTIRSSPASVSGVAPTPRRAMSVVACPSCGNKSQVPEQLLGQSVRCPHCAAPFVAAEGQPAGGPPPAQPAPLLVAGPDKGKNFTLPSSGTVQVGRGAEAEVHLTDLRVSRTHCTVEVAGDRLVVADAQSQRGTFVNGERLTADRPLRLGDVLEIGD